MLWDWRYCIQIYKRIGRNGSIIGIDSASEIINIAKEKSDLLTIKLLSGKQKILWILMYALRNLTVFVCLMVYETWRMLMKELKKFLFIERKRKS